VPVYAEAGRRGGYVIDKVLTLPPVNFTAAEVAAMAVSLAEAEKTPFVTAARSALRKVLAAAPHGQMAEAERLVNCVRLIENVGSDSSQRDGTTTQRTAVPAAIQAARRIDRWIDAL